MAFAVSKSGCIGQMAVALPISVILKFQGDVVMQIVAHQRAASREDECIAPGSTDRPQNRKLRDNSFAQNQTKTPFPPAVARALPPIAIQLSNSKEGEAVSACLTVPCCRKHL